MSDFLTPCTEQPQTLTKLLRGGVLTEFRCTVLRY